MECVRPATSWKWTKLQSVVCMISNQLEMDLITVRRVVSNHLEMDLITVRHVSNCNFFDCPNKHRYIHVR